MSITDQLIQLESSLLTPMVRASYDDLNRLIADDFVEVGASGRRFGKPDVLSRLPAERGIEVKSLNMNAKMLSPTVGLVTFDTERRMDGETRRAHRVSIWTLNIDQWQMIYHQGTVAVDLTE
jgi:hypothetical protein